MSLDKLNANFKEVYGEDLINLIPEAAKLTKLFKFVEKSKMPGGKYHQSVVVANEQGASYAEPDSGAFALEDAISMTLKDAQVQGASMLMRASISYEEAARATNSKQAFVEATELRVTNLLESATKRQEISALHGQVGLGITSGSVNSDSTHTVIQLTAASFAAGIWAGSEGSKLNFYRVDTDALVSSGADSIFTIDKVDVENRKLTLSGTATGINAIDALTASPGVIPYYKGSKTADMAGLRKQMTNTGTLFNISAADYGVWKGNSVTVTGQLTFGKLQSAIAKAVNRGLEEEVVVLVNPQSWSNLASDLAALRRFDESNNSKKNEMGTESLEFIGQNGKQTIMAYNLVKEGEAFVIPPKRVKFVGAQPISFSRPGEKEKIFLELANNAGYEIRCYTNASVFLETPCKAVYISGFTNA